MAPAIARHAPRWTSTPPSRAATGRAGDRLHCFRATGSVIRFPGFLAVYREGLDDGEDDDLDKGALPRAGRRRAARPARARHARAALHPAAAALHRGDAWSRRWRSRGSAAPAPTPPSSPPSRTAATCRRSEKRLRADRPGHASSTTCWSSTSRTIVDVGFTSQMEEELDEVADGRARLGAGRAGVLRLPSPSTVEKAAARWSG